MTKRFSVVVAALILSVALISSCYIPFDGPRPPGQPMPPPVSVSKAITPIPAAEAGWGSPMGDDTGCLFGSGDRVPSLPETDCVVWSFFMSLVVIADAVTNVSSEFTEAELHALETETYPLFLQAHQNCGIWTEPHDDYEGITDLFGFLIFMGVEHYQYDPSSLLNYLLENVADEEFAATAETIGCLKGSMLLFVEYGEWNPSQDLKETEETDE